MRHIPDEKQGGYGTIVSILEKDEDMGEVYHHNEILVATTPDRMVGTIEDPTTVIGFTTRVVAFIRDTEDEETGDDIPFDEQQTLAVPLWPTETTQRFITDGNVQGLS